MKTWLEARLENVVPTRSGRQEGAETALGAAAPDHRYWELHSPLYGCTASTGQTPDGLTEAVSKGSHLMRHCITQREQEKMLLDLMLKMKSVEICLLVSVEFEL